MTKLKKILIAVSFFIIIGFLIAKIIPEKYRTTSCNEKRCVCSNSATEEIKEIKCNPCSTIDPIFITGIINIFKFYSSGRNDVVIICKDNKNIGSRIDINKNEGRINANILLVPVYPFDSFNKFFKGVYRDFINSKMPVIKVPQSRLYEN